MDHVKYFKDLLESISVCGKILLLMFSTSKNVDLLNETGYLKNDINRPCLEFENTLLEQNEELDFLKNEERSILESFPNKQIEAYFTTMFEDNRQK